MRVTGVDYLNAYVAALQHVAATGVPVEAVPKDPETLVTPAHVTALRIARRLLAPVLGDGQPTPQVALLYGDEALTVEWWADSEALILWVDPKVDGGSGVEAEWKGDYQSLILNIEQAGGDYEWSFATFSERSRQLTWIGNATVTDDPLPERVAAEVRGWLDDADGRWPVENWLRVYWEAV